MSTINISLPNFNHVGTKGEKLSKVAKGTGKYEGTVWFHELSDK